MSTIIAGENYNYLFPLKGAKQSFEKFKQDFKLKIKSTKNYGQSLEFEILNTPGIFNNTIRRLIINEVPSVAIDKIYLYNNTGVVEDSDLALRVGLVPIDMDPDMLTTLEGPKPMSDVDLTAFNPDSCLLLELVATHKKREYLDEKRMTEALNKFGGSIPDKYIDAFNKRSDMSVYSDDIKWLPLDGQKEKFGDVKTLGSILLDRIERGEEIQMRVLGVKGYGHDHAKFMPTSSAYGRMAHKVTLKAPIVGENAKLLQSLFPEGVILIKKNAAVVGNPLLIKRTHKNYNEHEQLKGKVELSFDDQHYIWAIQSVRPKMQPAHKILSAAFQAMLDKCTFYIRNLDELAKAAEKDKTGTTNGQMFAKTLLGKNCFIRLQKPRGNTKFPVFQFVGETATLGTSLSYMITEKYGDEVFCAYSDIADGIELTLEIAGKKIVDDTTEILRSSLELLGHYFQHMKTCFEEEYASFPSQDVEME